MTKYSAPSIEVVNFSSSDAPRIGMQWWVRNSVPNGDSSANHWDALGSWKPANAPTFHHNGYNSELSCPSVEVYYCYGEQPPAGFAITDDNGTFYQVIDDGKSC